MTGVQHDTPSPQLVRYNDWRQVAVAAPGAFVPERPVSVVVPYYAQPEEGRGCWGELPPVDDTAALGRAMVAALRGERPTQTALRARAADFSDEKAADAYVALFDKLVTGHAR